VRRILSTGRMLGAVTLAPLTLAPLTLAPLALAPLTLAALAPGTPAHAAPPAAIPAMATAQETTPDEAATGQITFLMQEIDVGAGFTWGTGQLVYAGRTYDFTVSGGGLGGVGFSHIEGRGTVRNLTRLQDFDGTYWAVQAEATMGRGRGGKLLENNHQVDISLTTTTRGARLAAEAMRITLHLRQHS
jgi:outer membrane immunogenic protein